MAWLYSEQLAHICPNFKCLGYVDSTGVVLLGWIAVLEIGVQRCRGVGLQKGGMLKLICMRLHQNELIWHFQGSLVLDLSERCHKLSGV